MTVKIYGTELFVTDDSVNTMEKIRKKIIKLGYTEFEDKKTSQLVIDGNVIKDNIVFHAKG